MVAVFVAFGMLALLVPPGARETLRWWATPAPGTDPGAPTLEPLLFLRAREQGPVPV